MCIHAHLLMKGLFVAAAAWATVTTTGVQAAPAKKEPLSCYISDRKINREQTRINCIYKCPDGRLESEVIPRAAQCPSKIEVVR
jgi:hypothetical protein